jgi:DNA-binding HxlR family transcriptional regulator
MASSYGGSEAAVRTAEIPPAAASIGEVLRLLSAGPTGAILLALGEGPMQTKVLTHRVRGYTPRTVYRHLPKLAQLGVLEREDEPGGRAVVHTLSQGAGEELCDLVERAADTSMARLRDGQIKPEEWASLGLLADLWEAGVVEELSRGPKSPTELARGLDALSYHQLSRRASQFEASGFFVAATRGQRQRRRYSLTPKARRTMVLIAGIGRWRQRRSVEGAGLSANEMATVLRAVLPLAEAEGEDTVLLVEAEGGESVRCRETGGPGGDVWARAEVEDWMAVLLDGDLQVEAGEDPVVVEERLARLHEALWTP